LLGFALFGVYLLAHGRKDAHGVDALVHDLRTLRFTVDLYGDTRVALGTDYPFPLGEAHPGALIRSAGFAPDAQRRLLRGNAIDWLGGAGRLLKEVP
jgi:hypothetical protein